MTPKLRPYDEPPPSHRPLVPGTPDSAATALLVVSVLWLVAATGIGAFSGLQQLIPDFLTGSFSVPVGSGITLELTRQSVDAAFIDALVYGWLTNAALAAAFFALPRLTGRPVINVLAVLGAGAWNVAVGAGIALLYIKGASGSAPLAEFPLPVQALALLGLLALNAAFWQVVAAARGIGYVAIAYFGLGLLALLGSVALMALPNLVKMGDTTSLLVWAVAGRAVATYWVLGSALGALYYVIPRATRNPLSSVGLAWLAFGGWFAFAGLSAIGALVDPSVPYAVTSLGQTGTLLLLAPVFLAVANLLGGMSGRWSLLFSSGPVPYAVTAIVFLTGGALLESVGALRSVQKLTAGTDWSLGVTMIAVLGGGTFAFYALADHAAPRLLRRAWPGGVLADAQLWATLLGVVFAGLAMIGGGIVQGSLAVQGATADQISSTLLVFRLAIAGGLGLVALGGLSMLVSLFLAYTNGQPAEHPIGSADVAPAAAGH